jgi:hypothetical protein
MKSRREKEKWFIVCSFEVNFQIPDIKEKSPFYLIFLSPLLT